MRPKTVKIRFSMSFKNRREDGWLANDHPTLTCQPLLNGFGPPQQTFSTGLEVLQCSRTCVGNDRSPVLQRRSVAKYPSLHGPGKNTHVL